METKPENDIAENEREGRETQDRVSGFFLSVLLALSALLALAFVRIQLTEDNISTIAFWLIAVALLLHRRKNYLAPASAGIWPWVFLLLALCTATYRPIQYVSPAFVTWTFVFLLTMSLVAWLGGRRAWRLLFVPLFVLLVLIPVMPELIHWVSLPMRIMSTHIATFCLKLFGITVASRGTEILIGNERLAITAACSGVVLLQTMMWVVWIAVLRRYPPGWRRLLHYSFLLPVVIIGNSVRVMILAIAFQHGGTQVLLGPLHFWMGCLAIGIAAILYIFLEFLTNTDIAT